MKQKSLKKIIGRVLIGIIAVIAVLMAVVVFVFRNELKTLSS